VCAKNVIRVLWLGYPLNCANNNVGNREQYRRKWLRTGHHGSQRQTRPMYGFLDIEWEVTALCPPLFPNRAEASLAHDIGRPGLVSSDGRASNSSGVR